MADSLRRCLMGLTDGARVQHTTAMSSNGDDLTLRSRSEERGNVMAGTPTK